MSSARKTELQPWVTLKAGPVKFQSEAMRVAMMLPMLLVYEVAVLTFDQAAHWSVPPTQVTNRTVIAEMLRQVSSGGGTDLYKALEEARNATQEQSAKVKHVIVLSDGLTESEVDFEVLVREIAGNGATVSTVGFGGDPGCTADSRVECRLCGGIREGFHAVRWNPEWDPG